MAPNLPAFRGHDAIAAFFTAFLATGSVDIALTSTNVTQPSADVVWHPPSPPGTRTRPSRRRS